MVLPIPPPNVPFVDQNTGLIERDWYLYFKSRDRPVLSNLPIGIGGGSNFSAWYYGTPAPSNSLGVQNDFYIQISAPTPITPATIVAIYVKVPDITGKVVWT